MNLLSASALILVSGLLSGCLLIVDETHRHGPPPHAPAHGHHHHGHHHYHYYPDVEIYFDIDRSVYFYLSGGHWTMSATLPRELRISLGPFVRLELESARPYIRHKHHKKRYPRKRKHHKHKGNKKWD